tara:strand:- start:1134 stop:1316 length:183 start_codon:yes stop_codon:yes gene_type:complete
MKRRLIIKIAGNPSNKEAPRYWIPELLVSDSLAGKKGFEPSVISFEVLRHLYLPVTSHSL